MISHKTVNMAVVKADIDINIVPVIRWLNSYLGITTLFSCEGTDSGPNNPMAMFICNSSHSLVPMLIKLPLDARVELSWHENMLRYIINFRDRHSLYIFTKKHIPKQFKVGFKWSGKVPDNTAAKLFQAAREVIAKKHKAKKK